jgi:hypothetical protein
LGGDGKRSLQVFTVGETIFNLVTRIGHHELGFGIYDIGEQPEGYFGRKALTLPVIEPIGIEI